MEIKVITISKEGLTKENIIPKMDPYVKEHLKKTGDFREAFSLCERMTDEQFNALYHSMPERYLYVDTGCDEEWICDDTILSILKKFDLAVFWTASVKRHPIDQFIQNVRDNYNYERVSNQFDYSHITLAHKEN